MDVAERGYAMKKLSAIVWLLVLCLLLASCGVTQDGPDAGDVSGEPDVSNPSDSEENAEETSPETGDDDAGTSDEDDTTADTLCTPTICTIDLESVLGALPTELSGTGAESHTAPMLMVVRFPEGENPLFETQMSPGGSYSGFGDVVAAFNLPSAAQTGDGTPLGDLYGTIVTVEQQAQTNVDAIFPLSEVFGALVEEDALLNQPWKEGSETLYAYPVAVYCDQDACSFRSLVGADVFRTEQALPDEVLETAVSGSAFAPEEAVPISSCGIALMSIRALEDTSQDGVNTYNVELIGFAKMAN